MFCCICCIYLFVCLCLLVFFFLHVLLRWCLFCIVCIVICLSHVHYMLFPLSIMETIMLNRCTLHHINFLTPPSPSYFFMLSPHRIFYLIRKKFYMVSIILITSHHIAITSHHTIPSSSPFPPENTCILPKSFASP